LAVEPNIKECKEFKLVGYKDAIKEADVIAFLVAHKEFKNLDIPEDKILLDFCGVLNV
jgi:UDP-N-acetyl-D-mannosaminuronic acid dehydrogenase